MIKKNGVSHQVACNQIVVVLSGVKWRAKGGTQSLRQSEVGMNGGEERWESRKEQPTVTAVNMNGLKSDCAMCRARSCVVYGCIVSMLRWMHAHWRWHSHCWPGWRGNIERTAGASVLHFVLCIVASNDQCM